MINIPSNYEEYDSIEFCSNKLSNVKYLIGIGSIPPIIISKGEKGPIVWINFQNRGVWIELVSANRSMYEPLQIFAHDGKLLIQIDDTVILDAFERDRDALIIQKIDLKPIGYNIEGNSTRLMVGGTTLSGNTIIGGRFFIALG